MRKFWLWLIGPAWIYGEGGEQFSTHRTDPATGRVQVWDDSDMVTGWHSGDWRDLKTDEE